MTSNSNLDELLVRALQGRVTHDEDLRIRAWLDAAPENRAQFDELRQVWRIAERASPPVQSAWRPSASDLTGRTSGSAAAVAASSSPASRARQGYRWLAPLAAAAAVAAIALGISLTVTASGEPGPFFGVAEFSTGASEKATVRLGDGTIVRLGTSSSLQVDGTGGERKAWLKGNAFFAVAHNPSATFTVRTPAGTATVLGTRFDVRAGDNDLRLVVVDGRVRVAVGTDGQYSAEVGPSEMGHAVEGGRVYVSRVQDVYALLDWMDEALIFQATPLDRVAAELAYRYGTPVEVVTASLASRSITAWFTDEPLDEVVTVICRAAHVMCEVSEAGVRIGI